jgi:hypothetical protein
MTKTLAINPLRYGRRVGDHDINVQVPDRAVPTAFANVITDAWVLPIYYWIFHYVMAERIVRNNTEAIAAATWALEPIATRDKVEEKLQTSMESFDSPSLVDLLASDRCSFAREPLGGQFVSNLTTPFRKDLVLASSVVR